MFNGEEVFNHTFITVYKYIIYIAFVVTFSSNVFLITAIIKKTPKFMNNLKAYLIPYAIFTLIIQFVFLLYTPMLFHPYIYIYPIGVAKLLPRNVSIIIIGLGVWSAIMFLGCSNGMAMERFFALRNIQYVIKQPSPVPLRVFMTLSFGALVALFGCILGVYIKPLNSLLFVSPEENFGIMETSFYNLSQSIDLNYVVIFRGAEHSLYATLLLFFGGIFLLQIASSLTLTLLNIHKFHKLKPLLSFNTYRNNTVLIRVAYLQLFGIFTILGLPLFGAATIFWLISTPCFQINYFIMFMSFYGFYDTFITVICIKPYRLYLFNLFKKPPKSIATIFSSVK